MSGRGGRDRVRRDYPPRSEEKSHRGRSNAPPSRHLWVGNLAQNLSERMLADHFLQFGELESVAFIPGRSYAFINFKHNEAAFAAIEALQGVFVAGNPLVIEFAKPEKALIQPRGEDYSHRRDEHRSSVRRSPFPERDSRDSRVRHSSPEKFYNDNSKMDDKNAEPSEVLWVGFPASLRVDEELFRNAFSQYGEIEKISVFPGRTYAFVRFRNVMAACKAKENLHGKLFGNPRVHICFAKSESGSSNGGKNPMNAPPSPRGRPFGRQGSSEPFHQDRYVGNLPGDPSMRSSPRLPSNVGPGDHPDSMNFDRKRNLWADGDGPFEKRRLQGHGPELEMPRNMYNSPPRDSGSRFQTFPPPPPQQFPSRQGPFYEDSWELPEDTLELHGAKKQKTSPFPTEAELPEYPFSDNEKVKHRVHDFHPQRGRVDEKFDSGHFNYNKQIHDPAMNIRQSYGERNDLHNRSYDNFQGGPVLLPPLNPVVDWKRSTPEVRPPPVAELWKWEGTIAKGGTAVCRARCFPVGKVLDMPLPEILDCTARTGLDMLAKHYYQAASAWVVFFVPGSDADMGFYNEFMNYLGEKERAAVAKLDDKNTLFLVPPSDFSEKILKVPGKLSISGVILRLEPPPPPPPPTGLGSLPPPPERSDTNFSSFHGEPHLTASPSGPYPSNPNHGNQRVNSSLPGHFPTNTPPESFVGPSQSNRSTTGFFSDDRQAHYPQNFNSGGRIMSSVDPTVQSYNPAMPRVIQEPNTNINSYYTPGISGPPLGQSGSYPHQEVKSTMPMAALQPDQLAQLASTLLGQPRQQDFRQVNVAESSYNPSQNYPQNNNQYSAELLSSSQYGQMQQFQQLQIPNISAPPQREDQPGDQGSGQMQKFQQHMSSMPVAPQSEGQPGGQGSGQMQQFQQQMSNMPVASQREGQLGGQGSQSGGAQEEGDADPQRRLQATLQLAAALLQQIQQGKGT